MKNTCFKNNLDLVILFSARARRKGYRKRGRTEGRKRRQDVGLLCGSPSVPQSRSLQREPKLAHRVWLSSRTFGDLHWSSLESFSQAGWRQLLWTDQPDVRYESNSVSCLAGVSIMSIDEHIEVHEVADMLENNVPVQHIKDAISFAVVLRYGGLFADLKLLWLPGRSLPGSGRAGVRWASEPAKQFARSTSRASEMDHVSQKRCFGQPWLGCFAAPVGAGQLKSILGEITPRLRRHAAQVRSIKCPRIDWSIGQKTWMKHTQAAYDHLTLEDEVLEPRVVCGIPAFVRAHKPGTSHYNYYVPTVAELVADGRCCAITVWSERQWPLALQASVRAEFQLLTDTPAFNSCRALLADVRAVEGRLGDSLAARLCAVHGLQV